MNHPLKFILLLALFGFSIPLTATASDTWSVLADEISQQLDLAVMQSQEGQYKEAKRSLVKAYFGVFEDKKMEAAMRTSIGQKHTYLVERQFGKLRKAVNNKVDTATIKSLAEVLKKDLQRDAKTLDEKQVPLHVFEVNK